MDKAGGRAGGEAVVDMQVAVDKAGGQAGGEAVVDMRVAEESEHMVRHVAEHCSTEHMET